MYYNITYVLIVSKLNFDLTSNNNNHMVNIINIYVNMYDFILKY